MQMLLFLVLIVASEPVPARADGGLKKIGLDQRGEI
jgi:hypothetical protein